MKLFILIVALVAFLANLLEAYPQKFINRLPPPRPPPTTRPRPMRVRRQVLGGQLVSNPNGGADARLDLSKGIGTPDHNVIGNVFAAGNTDRGPVATGGSLSYNNNGLGASIAKEHIPGVRDTFTKSATANLFNDGVHSLDAKVFKSDNTLANGFKFERNGHGFDYSHINGHGASLVQNNIPGVGKQLELGGRANLWSSVDRNTRLDLTGTASKWQSGPFSGQSNFGGNLGLTHMFG